MQNGLCFFLQPVITGNLAGWLDELLVKINAACSVL
jgi:hypothetical protein